MQSCVSVTAAAVAFVVSNMRCVKRVRSKRGLSRSSFFYVRKGYRGLVSNNVSRLVLVT